MPEKIIDIDEHIRDIQEISIAIDSWDDVFSDFDPSPLEQRILSEDFLAELKKRYRETSRGSFVITIYAPASLRDDVSERIVIKRLKQYFKLRHLSVLKDINDARLKGILFVVFGVIFLATLTLVTYHKLMSHLVIELMAIVLMPLGWFGIWEGFSRVIDPSVLDRQEADVFGKLAKAAIKFKYAGVPTQGSEDGDEI